jgi:hypothetical protein
VAQRLAVKELQTRGVRCVDTRKAETLCLEKWPSPKEGKHMQNTYSYRSLNDLSPQELFSWIAIDQTLEQLGGADIAAAAAVLSGQPFLPTRAKFGGATKGTSVASVVSRKLLRHQLPFALPTLTGASIRSLKLTFTRSLGAFVGRLVPGVGWTILTYDVVQIIRKTVEKYNLLAKKEDQLW